MARSREDFGKQAEGHRTDDPAPEFDCCRQWVVIGGRQHRWTGGRHHPFPVFDQQ